MTGQACVRFTAAILTGLSSLESILLFWNFQAEGIGFVSYVCFVVSEHLEIQVMKEEKVQM